MRTSAPAFSGSGQRARVEHEAGLAGRVAPVPGGRQERQRQQRARVQQRQFGSGGAPSWGAIRSRISTFVRGVLQQRGEVGARRAPRRAPGGGCAARACGAAAQLRVGREVVGVPRGAASSASAWPWTCGVDRALEIGRVKPSSRAASAMCGDGGCWPWSGVRRRIASAGASVRRSIRNWRAASAAVSSFRVRTRIGRSVGWSPWPSPSRCPTPTAPRLPLHVDGAPAAVVVFTCNHCPYALAWHERIQDVARDYADRGVRVLQINPNDAQVPARLARRHGRASRRASSPRRTCTTSRRRSRVPGARRRRRTSSSPTRRASSTAARRTPTTATVAECGVAAGRARRRARRPPGRQPRDQAGRLLDQVEVELLYWEGCPSHPAALADLREALGEEVPVTVREVASEEQAVAERFPGRRRSASTARTCSRPTTRRALSLPHLPPGRRPLLPHARPRRAAGALARARANLRG